MMKKNWDTYYLYYTGNADKVLTEIVHPSIEEVQVQLGETIRFFFIRYFENGYHIRLRLLLSSGESSIFFNILTRCISDYESAYATKITLKKSRYIPETERYGNSHTIAFAEEQFYASSLFVLRQLTTKDPLTYSERYLLAVNAHLAFFKGMALSRKHILEICDTFIESWLPIPASLEPGGQNQYKKSLLDAFKKQFNLYQASLCENAKSIWNPQNIVQDSFLLKLIDANREVGIKYLNAQLPDKKINEVLASFIHMTNNRIGIINSEESYLLFLVRQTIAQIQKYDYE